MPRLPDDPDGMRLCYPYAAAVPSRLRSPEEPTTQTCAGMTIGPQGIISNLEQREK